MLFYRYGICQFFSGKTSYLALAIAIVSLLLLRHYFYFSHDETELLSVRLFNGRDEACLRSLCAELTSYIPNNNLLTNFLELYNRPHHAHRTVQASLNVCKGEIKRFKEFLDELENYIESIRLKNVTQIQTTQFSQTVRPYLAHSVTFWNQRREQGKDRIVLDTDNAPSNR